ncbi:MAG: CBS domain-containing protein, partial [Clostridia bacterium]|nr:CBS domain-containing protein [Clostridia bacterium]
MKVCDCMTKQVVSISPDESAEVAARLMARYNVGMLPVRRSDGMLVGVVTDRDLVLRCMAGGKKAHQI